MYAMVSKRLDVAFVVSKVTQFLSNHGLKHWVVVKRIFK
jgi:hypothetical protein